MTKYPQSRSQTRVKNFRSTQDMRDQLEAARMNASNDWEEKFVATALEKFNAYGNEAFWTEQQDAILLRISGEED